MENLVSATQKREKKGKRKEKVKVIKRNHPAKTHFLLFDLLMTRWMHLSLLIFSIFNFLFLFQILITQQPESVFNFLKGGGGGGGAGPTPVINSGINTKHAYTVRGNSRNIKHSA